MYIPDLSPRVKIPGLPAVAQERLRELLEKMIDARPQFPQYLNTRIDRELNAIERLNSSLRLREEIPPVNQTAAESKVQSAVIARQIACGCQFVAEVLALRLMISSRIEHARALAWELATMKERAGAMPENSAYVALYVNLSVLVSRFGRGHPDDALQYLQRLPERSERYALKSVRTKFEEIAENPVVKGQGFDTLGFLVPFVEKPYVHGVESELRRAVRNAENARFACIGLNLTLGDSLSVARAQILTRLDIAVHEDDKKDIERIKEEIYEIELGYAARVLDLIDFTDKLQKAQSRLSEVLAAACAAIFIGSDLPIVGVEGVENLAAVINCISAHSLLQEIAHELPTFTEKTRKFDRTPKGMRRVAGEMIERVLSLPELS